MNYYVDVGKGQIWKRHLNQLWHRFGEIRQPATLCIGRTHSSMGENGYYPFEQDAPPPEQDAPDLLPGMDPPPDTTTVRDPSPVRKRPYPQREHHPPERYGRPVLLVDVVVYHR